MKTSGPLITIALVCAGLMCALIWSCSDKGTESKPSAGSLNSVFGELPEGIPATMDSLALKGGEHGSRLLWLMQQTTYVEFDFFGKHCSSEALSSCLCETAPIQRYSPEIDLDWDDSTASASFSYFYFDTNSSLGIQNSVSCTLDVSNQVLSQFSISTYYHSVLGTYENKEQGCLTLYGLPLERVELSDKIYLSFFCLGPDLEEIVTSFSYSCSYPPHWIRNYRATDYSDPDCPPWIRVTFTGPLPE